MDGLELEVIVLDLLVSSLLYIRVGFLYVVKKQEFEFQESLAYLLIQLF